MWQMCKMWESEEVRNENHNTIADWQMQMKRPLGVAEDPFPELPDFTR